MRSRRAFLHGIGALAAGAALPGTGRAEEPPTYAEAKETYRTIIDGFEARREEGGWANLDRIDRIPFAGGLDGPVYQGETVAWAGSVAADAEETYRILLQSGVRPANPQAVLDYQLGEEHDVTIDLVDVCGDGETWLDGYRTFVSDRLRSYFDDLASNNEDVPNVEVTVETSSVDLQDRIDAVTAPEGNAPDAHVLDALNGAYRQDWRELPVYLTRPEEDLDNLGFWSGDEGAGLVQVRETARDPMHEDDRYHAVYHEVFHGLEGRHNLYDGYIDENPRNRLRHRDLFTTDITPRYADSRETVSPWQPVPWAGSDTLAFDAEGSTALTALAQQEYLQQMYILFMEKFPEWGVAVDLDGWYMDYRGEPSTVPDPVDIVDLYREVEEGTAHITLKDATFGGHFIQRRPPMDELPGRPFHAYAPDSDDPSDETEKDADTGAGGFRCLTYEERS